MAADMEVITLMLEENQERLDGVVVERRGNIIKN